VVGIFLDLQKAFDTVNHDILLYKMYNYGIGGVAYKWFVSCQSNRKQYTVYVISDTRDVHYGVPQGSVVGPLLFLIYVNDIARALRYLVKNSSCSLI